MKQELEQYRQEPSSFWNSLPMMGVDGYEVIELADNKGWNAISCWGRDGYDLGSWPLVIVFHKDGTEGYAVIEYVEGDVCLYVCPTKELREAITDSIAFFHWKHSDESWVANYETIEQLPEELRGPYRREQVSK